MKKRILFLAAAAMLGTSAHAKTISTRVTSKALTAVCAENREACLTYVLGAVDTFTSILTLTDRPNTICLPAGTTNDQIARTAVQYLRAHPEEGGGNAAISVIAALREAYPCGY